MTNHTNILLNLYCVGIGHTTTENLDFYKLKMALFDKGKPDEFLFFIRNFNMTLEASGTLKADTNIQYLRALVRGEALPQFDTLSAEVGSASSEKLTYIILGLGT